MSIFPLYHENIYFLHQNVDSIFVTLDAKNIPCVKETKAGFQRACHICFFIYGFICKYYFAAMFMLRDPSFLETVPEEYQKAFVESNPVAPVKLEMLKKMIHERFPVRKGNILW